MILKKYYAGFIVNLKQFLAYRLYFFMSWISTPILIFIHYFIWLAVYNHSGNGLIAGFSFSDMVMYIVTVQVVGRVSHTRVGVNTGQYVLKGSLTKYIIKPFAYIHQMLIKELARWSFAAITSGIPIILIGIYFFKFDADLTRFLLLIVTVCIACLLKFMLSINIAMLAFWIKKYSAIDRLWFGLRLLLGGMVIPLNFFPSVYQNIFKYLPFQYIAYFPTIVFIGKISLQETLKLIGVSVAWLIVLLLLYKIVWKKALNKYCGVGT